MANTNKLAYSALLYRCVLCAFLFLYGLMPARAQTNGYFISFADKKGTAYVFDKPLEYLSERAVLRRQHQQIAIDSTDLPVNKAYVDSLRKLNIVVRHLSKWMNGAVVFSNDAALMDTLYKVGFIKKVELTKGPFTSSQKIDKQLVTATVKAASIVPSDYGESYLQLQTVNGIALHQQGFMGSGMHIAVIDAGFFQFSSFPLTAHLASGNQILGAYDFVDPGTNVTDDDTHGMQVLSILAGWQPGQYIGTAPEASYWLFRTEDITSEYPIEADYWLCAAEKADSAGVDVITSSLGYAYYNNPSMDLTYSALDGSSRVSVAANMAVSKGMVVVNSAGNEGNKWWKYVMTPADAPSVLAVGAVSADSIWAPFSSLGPTADGRTKPDVMAMGVQAAVQAFDGSIVRGNGTSYSTPVIAGLVACLWQKNPNFTSLQMVGLVRQISNRYQLPDNYYGYGIPDFGAVTQSVDDVGIDDIQVWPNPFVDMVYVTCPSNHQNDKISLNLVNANGVIVAALTSNGAGATLDGLGRLGSGVYLLIIKHGNSVVHYKLLKH